jgi:hypothetical protein
MSNTNSCRVLQLNVARSNARMHAILNDCTDFDICLFQDPWWGKIGVERSSSFPPPEILGTISCPAWDCFLPPLASGSGSCSPDVVIYVRKGRSWLSAALSSLVPSCASMLALDVSVSGFQVCLVCIYRRGSGSPAALRSLLDFPVHPSPIIYAGDFNLHHELWSLPGCPSSSQTGLASDVADWIRSNGISIANTPNTPTRLGLGNQSDSVIDLTLTNQYATDAGCLSDWECHRSLAFGSDHQGITWLIQAPPDTPFDPRPPVYRYCIDTVNREDWVNAFTGYLDHNPLPLLYRTRNDLEFGARTLLEAMSEATRRSMKRLQLGRGPPRALWWNDDCSLAVQQIKNVSNTPCEKEVARARLRQAIRSARRNAANKICQSIATAEDLFKITNWASGRRASRMPPISGPNGMAITPDDQAQAFRTAFFPIAPPPVDLRDNFGIHQRPARDHHPISKHEIQSALDTSSNTSAPGAFGSNYRLLKWVFESDPELLVKLYNGCLDLSFHPECLRKAVISVIPKPRKLDMSNPKSYRPISLLECLSKCLEKVVTNRIMFDVGKFNLVPFTQFGGRDASSCIDAGLSLVHDIQSAWKNRRSPSLLTLDISGYFNNINHQRLILTLRTLGFPDRICSWLESYLSQRSVTFRIDNQDCSPILLSPVGVPQGSPLSPILSSIYTLPVLRALDHFHNITVKAFIDDFSILTFSNSFTENVETLRQAVSVVANVLTQLGLSFELPKSELVHFAANKAAMSSNPDVVLDRPDGGTHTVRALSSLRWLGFHLDRRLDFQDHVKKMAAKGLSVIAGLRVLANCVRGISVAHARLLYKVCVMPILTYGSPIWYTGVRQKHLFQPLIKAQNTGLRWLLGAFSTSPVPAMEHAASILPIPLALRRLSENAASRLHPKLPNVFPRFGIPTIRRYHTLCVQTPIDLPSFTGLPVCLTPRRNISFPTLSPLGSSRTHGAIGS